MSNLRSVIKSFFSTQYYNEWLLALKDSPELFSTDNIKPCLKIDNNHVQFVFWDGLDILSIYKNKQQDEEIDNFIINLLNESIEKYKNDKNENDIDKLNANFPVIDKLMAIALTKAIFIEKIDFISFFKIYLDSCFLHLYSFFNNVKNNYDEFIKINPNLIYEIIKSIIDCKRIKRYELKPLYTELFSGLIRKNPIPYYSLAYDVIINRKLKCYDMGAFIDYINHGPYLDNELAICFYLLKESSKVIDELKLKNNISELLNSSNDYHKRIGLALININYKKLSDLFFDNIHIFFNESTYYLDLCSLLSNHFDSTTEEYKRKELIDELNVATFGCNNTDKLDILKNKIKIILHSKGFKISFIPETNKMKEFATNYNRYIYTSDFDVEGEADIILSKIQKLSIDEALEEYKKKKNSSDIYTDVLNKAYIKYFRYKEINISKIFNKLDFSLITEIITEYKNDILKFNEYLNLAIDLMNEKNDYSIISTIIYNIETLIRNEKYNEAYTLMKKIDLNLINFTEIEEYDVSHCISHIFCAYCENYSSIAIAYKSSRSDYLMMITRALQVNNPIVKGVVAKQLPLIKNFDESFFLSIIENVLDNNLNEINLSYAMLGYSGYLNMGNIIGYIRKRQDFKDFFLIQSIKLEDIGGLESILYFLLKDYLSDDDYETIKIIFGSNNYKIIYNGLISSLYFFNQGDFRYEIYIKRFIEYAKCNNIDSFDAEMIIKDFSNSIIKLGNKKDFLWDGILILFNYFNNYVSGELISLLKTYKYSEKEKVTKIIELFIEKYDKNVVYVDTLADIFDIFKNDHVYKEKLKKWMVALYNKNDELDDFIKSYISY